MKTTNLNLAFSNGVLMNRPFAWMKIGKVPGTINGRPGFTSEYFVDAATDTKVSVIINDLLKKVAVKYHGSVARQNAAIRAAYVIK